MPKEKLKSHGFGIGLQCWNSNWSYLYLLGIWEKQMSNSTSSQSKQLFLGSLHSIIVIVLDGFQCVHSWHGNAGNRMPFSSHRVSETEENFVIKKTHCNFSAFPRTKHMNRATRLWKVKGFHWSGRRPLTKVALDGFRARNCKSN